MAIVKPFQGIRPPKELVEKVQSRPYDVLNSEEAKAEAAGNEMSLYHIIKPEIDFDPIAEETDPRVYAKAAENFKKFQDNGWLKRDTKEQYYIYAQTMNGKTQYGLVVCAYVEDYLKGNIKKHELTRADKEEDRMKHVRVNNANIEPVFFAYPDDKVLDELVAKYVKGAPEYDYVAQGDGFRHQLWIIDKDEDISLQKFPSIDKKENYLNRYVSEEEEDGGDILSEESQYMEEEMDDCGYAVMPHDLDECQDVAESTGHDAERRIPINMGQFYRICHCGDAMAKVLDYAEDLGDKADEKAIRDYIDSLLSSMPDKLR